MDIVKELRLYRIITVLNIAPKFWKKSSLIAKENSVSTLYVFKDMLGCFFKYGASEDNYEQFHYYGKDHTYRDSFITWRRNMKIMSLFNTWDAKKLFLNKVEWNRRFSKYVKRDWIYSKEATVESLIEFLKNHDEVIVKTIDGACGQGIDKYLSKELLNKDAVLNSILEKDCIVEEVAVNIPEIKSFSPNSLNTIRIVTCVDKKGEVHIITTALRVGNGQTFKDNTHSGGFASVIESKSGTIVTDGIDYKGTHYIKHPVTGMVFKGFKIPLWNECLKVIKNIAKEECQEARFVGWDVAITSKGIDILEGNIPPGEDLTQADSVGRYYNVKKML